MNSTGKPVNPGIQEVLERLQMVELTLFEITLLF